MVTAAPSRAGELGGTRYSMDAPKILAECCEQGTLCRFQLVHCEFSESATFCSTHDDWTELAMASTKGDEPIQLHSISCVSFSYGNSYCAFLGCLIDVRRPEPGELRIVVTTPSSLTVTNLRQSFRIPVIDQAGLETTIRTSEQKEFFVSARDISESGLEIEFAPETEHRLCVGASIIVKLKYRGEIVQRVAQVRRLFGDRCGIFFGNPTDEETRRQAAAMRGIALSLQQFWLRNRLL